MKNNTTNPYGVIQWTNKHCERCYGEDNPQLRTHEIYCLKHYKEYLSEDAED